MTKEEIRSVTRKHTVHILSLATKLKEVLKRGNMEQAFQNIDSIIEESRELLDEVIGKLR